MALQLEFRESGVCNCVSLDLSTFVFECLCLSWLSTDLLCICRHVWVRTYTVTEACVRDTHHEGWQVRAVDHKWGHWLTARLCGQACPNLCSLPLPDFKPLFTLMDSMSYFPATLGCCIIKCQITVTHHLDRKCIVCGKQSTKSEKVKI